MSCLHGRIFHVAMLQPLDMTAVSFQSCRGWDDLLMQYGCRHVYFFMETMSDFDWLQCDFLSEKHAFIGSVLPAVTWIVGDNHIATWLMVIRPPSVVGDAGGFKSLTSL